MGKSAYEIAVRLGKFTGTEEEWANYIEIERAAAVKSIEEKGAETLSSIPDDYTELAEQVVGKIDKTSIAQELGDSEEKVLSQKAATEAISDLYETKLPVVATDGKYINYDGQTLNSDTSCATDYIAINSGYTIKIENLFLETNRSICTYDDRKKLVRVLANSSADETLTFTVAEGEKFVRATGRAGKSPVMTLINKPITTDIKKLNENVQTAIDLGESIVNRYIELPTPKVGYMVQSDGVVDVNSLSDAYEMIPVQRGYTIKVTNAFTLTGRAISAYNADGVFVKCLATNSDTNDLLTYKFVVDDYDFISVTTKTGESISVEYVDKWLGLSEEMLQAEMTNDFIGNYDKLSIVLDKNKFVNGYLNAYGKVNANDNYKTTDFLKIENGRKITIKNFMAVSFVYVYFYNRYKDVVSSVESEMTATAVSSFEIEVPKGVEYVRYTLSPSQIDTTVIEYSNPYKKNYAEESELVRSWNKKAFEKIGNLFDKATSKPIITIIDDDTISTANVEAFYNACNNLGVKGTYACLTRQFTTDNTLKDKLLEYQRKGFQTVCHGYIQGDFYQNNELRDVSACEDDLIHCMQDLSAAGFIDFKFWVTPFGVFDADMQRLAKRLGHDCLVMIGSEEIETTEAKYGRFALRRPGFTPDTDVNKIKGLIDECVSKNGWLLLGTHIYHWSDMTNFNEVVNYAKEKGCEFMTLGEAYREREAIYRFYETF